MEVRVCKEELAAFSELREVGSKVYDGNRNRHVGLVKTITCSKAYVETRSKAGHHSKGSNGE